MIKLAPSSCSYMTQVSSCTYISMCMNQMLRSLATTNYGLLWICVSSGRGAQNTCSRCQISWDPTEQKQTKDRTISIRGCSSRTRIDSTAAAAAAVTTNCQSGAHGSVISIENKTIIRQMSHWWPVNELISQRHMDWFNICCCCCCHDELRRPS